MYFKEAKQRDSTVLYLGFWFFNPFPASPTFTLLSHLRIFLGSHYIANNIDQTRLLIVFASMIKSSLKYTWVFAADVIFRTKILVGYGFIVFASMIKSSMKYTWVFAADVIFRTKILVGYGFIVFASKVKSSLRFTWVFAANVIFRTKILVGYGFIVFASMVKSSLRLTWIFATDVKSRRPFQDKKYRQATEQLSHGLVLIHPL